ncbi:unnamed protein product [Trichobilharzia szidati]|nr:unnamed protein product [Trichobilharzia szidati]
MFWNRLRKTDNLIECVTIFNVSDTTGDPVLEYVYPYAYNEDFRLNKLHNFVLPCRHKSLISEEYTLIFTDANGNLEFFLCILLPISKYIVCVSSCLPYFELLHSLITLINQEHLYLTENRQNIEVVLKRLHQHCGEAILDLSVLSSPPSSARNTIKSSILLPDAQTQFFYDRHILEYYNTLSIGNWIVIFESLLLEKSVIFYSSRLQRVTSCLLASLSLLYPLIWPHLIYTLLPPDCIDYVGCPTPFVAGVHSCLTERMKPLLVPGVRLVDLDHDIVYGTGDSGLSMPSVLRHWLIRRCNASHSAILRHIRSTENVASTAALLLVRPYLELMAILLGGYRSALQHNESSSSVNLVPIHSGNNDTLSKSKFDQPCIGGWFFDRAAFVVSCGRELQPYLTELLNSQMVIQFFESRVAVLNSNLSVIPPDDFEDTIDHVSLPRRSGGFADLLNFGRSEFDKITRKLTGRSDKLSQKLFNRPNNLYQTFKLNGSSVDKQDHNGSFTPKVYTKKSYAPSVSCQPPQQDICQMLRKQLNLKEDNKTATTPVLREKNVNGKQSSQNRSAWQPLSPQIDTELRRSERTNRSLLTSILAELPDFSFDHLSVSSTSQDDCSQVPLRKSLPNNKKDHVASRRSSTSKRRGCYIEPSDSGLYRDWVSFDSSPSPPHHSPTNLVNLDFSTTDSVNSSFHPFTGDKPIISLSSSGMKQVNCDPDQLEKDIMDEFDQLSISRIRKS